MPPPSSHELIYVTLNVAVQCVLNGKRGSKALKMVRAARKDFSIKNFTITKSKQKLIRNDANNYVYITMAT